MKDIITVITTKKSTDGRFSYFVDKVQDNPYRNSWESETTELKEELLRGANET